MVVTTDNSFLMNHPTMSSLTFYPQQLPIILYGFIIPIDLHHFFRFRIIGID